MAEPFPLEPSLWAATAPAAVADAAPAGVGHGRRLHRRRRLCRPLDGAPSRRARHQGRGAGGKEPGFGGSGRNGGQVIPGLKFDPDELETMFGKERGPRLVDFVSRTADVVWELIDKHRMDVPNTRTGWIQSAMRAGGRPDRGRAPRNGRSAARPVDVLDRRETEQHVGHGQYLAPGSIAAAAWCSRWPMRAAWPRRRSRPARRSTATHQRPASRARAANGS